MSDPAQDPTELVHSLMPLTKTLGMRVRESSTEQVVFELDWQAELCTSNGLLHGGTLMALADAVGGLLAFQNLPDGSIGTTTVESKTNFIGAAREGSPVVATGTVLHKGGTTIIIETEVRSAGKLVTKTTQTQLVLKKR